MKKVIVWIWWQKREKNINMNKQDMMLFVKFMVEMDKKLINEDEKYNLSKSQKEFLKLELDKYYEKFKRS